MSDETGYQGWTNYETWAVALWLDNDEGSYSYWHEQAQSALRERADQSGATDAAEYAGERDWIVSRAAGDLADMLKDEHVEASHDFLLRGNDAADASVFDDLLGAALGSVDWYEVAHHYIDEHVDEVFAELASTDEATS